jgi:transcriptional regulator with XRE-family HTH domain
VAVTDGTERPARAERSVFPGFGPTTTDPGELIDRLAALRRQHRLSQTEVAARMGTSQSALARLESGQSDVRLSTIMRYASALGADIGFDLRVHDEEGG